jgi:hypothetical protein
MGKSMRTYLKNNERKWLVGMNEVVEHLPSKPEAPYLKKNTTLSSNHG